MLLNKKKKDNKSSKQVHAPCPEEKIEPNDYGNYEKETPF
jgi:hypothetical protein